MPPITVSSQSRNKLQAFQYDQENAPPSEGKEHGVVPKTYSANVNRTKSGLAQGYPSKASSQDASRKSGLKEPKECPQTPISRLPLAELIASGEDFKQTLNLTPEERVLWNNSTRTSDLGSSQDTPALPKRKRRAHSSSPISSSQKHKKTSDFFAAGEKSADLQPVRKTLKTPQGDPASELWKKYSLNIHDNDKLSPSKTFGQPFSQLLNSSSPQTPAYKLFGRESNVLRRSFSCGTEWPTSAAKRRRVGPAAHDGDSPDGLNITTGVPPNPEKPKSRLSLLVAKISGDLAKHASNDMPAASSGSASHKDRLASPEMQLQEDCDHEAEAKSQVLNATVADLGPDAEGDSAGIQLMGLDSSPKEVDDMSDEFGDDDIDLETFDVVNAQMGNQMSQTGDSRAQDGHLAAAIEHTADKNIANPNMNDDVKATIQNADGASQRIRPTPVPSSRTPTSVIAVEACSDEFGSGVNEVSVEDLENVIAVCEQQTVQTKPSFPVCQADTPVTSQKQSTVYGSSPGDVQLNAVVEHQVPEDDAALSEDDFGGDGDLEDMVAECDRATQAYSSTLKPHNTSDRQSSEIQRYVIQTVADSFYETKNGQRRPEKVLLVQNESKNASKALSLRDSWVDSPCTPGSIVNIIGHFNRAGQCVVDDTHNMILLHPDYLISATVVADSFSCTRRAILQDRVKTTSDTSQPTIYGHLLHEIFQEALKANRWDDEWLGTTIESIASRYLEQLFEINVELNKAVNDLKSRAKELQTWAEVFVAAKPKATATIRDRNGGQALMSVNKLLEVEEKIWSPRFGLKGNVDATVQIALQDDDNIKTLTVPFELKTGKHVNAAHKAQTALYTLLCSDRYDVNVACGVLFYMESSEVSRIPAVRHEMIHMIKQRNELACFLRQKQELPLMLRNSPHLCGKCYAQTPCFIYNKLVDDGNGGLNGLKDLFDDQVNYLKPVHQAFFKKWDDLLTKEENDIVKFRREVWAMQSSEREKLGRCFGDVCIEAGSFSEDLEAPKINRYRYTFVKKNGAAQFSFADSQITLGEPIVVSDEKGHFALASGYVTSIRKSKVTVTVDRRLHNARGRRKHFDSQTNQSFAGIMEVMEDAAGQSTLTPSQPEEEILYRIDKDEFSNGMAIVRNNLINIMQKYAFNAQPLRRLIVENTAPTFRPVPSSYSLGESASQASLNVDQRAAIEKVMSAKDYALVLGMPGTGKTTTIAHIIRALTAQGKSVLLASYTHTAVDNILLKIRKDNIGVFRLGATAKIHPEVQEFADLAGVPFKTVEELKRAYGQQVVATTCLGINHPIFNQRIFDYCIVDEASQITLPVCLGPIRLARTFILVGDHYQLPPLVQNAAARKGGLDISLFKLLSDAHPSSVVNLEHQYRMCADIMLLSNKLIYDGRLKCGTQAVADRTLSIPNIDALRLHHHSPSSILSSSAATPARRICLNTPSTCFLKHLLSPSRRTTFINTDPLLPASLEAASGSRITNPFEATLTTQLVESFLTAGVPTTDIGVITLYRSQLSLLKHNLRHRPQVEMHTADKFQGRDKEVVILSLVRSNAEGNVGDLLRDWRRVNVSLTRARTKLLVIGSKKTLLYDKLLNDFVTLVEDKGWRYDLPQGALEMHVFDDGASQLSSRAEEVDAVVEVKPAAGEGKEIGGKGAKKVPMKRAGVDIRHLMGKRGVLRDIVNDAA